MQSFISVFGITVGMHQSEVVRVLTKRNIPIGQNQRCIFNQGKTDFLGNSYSVIYSLKDARVREIKLTWTFDNKGRLNNKEDEERIYSVFDSIDDFVLSENVFKYSETKKCSNDFRSVYCEYLNLYNRVNIASQYKCNADKINAVSVFIKDINDGELKIEEFEFLRSQVQLKEHMKESLKIKPVKSKNSVFPKLSANNIIKLIIIAVIAIIGLLYVQNNRYYYAKNGKVRVDKWKNERTILNSYGTYVKE